MYAWLAHRLHRIHGRGVTLYWANLREQFAQEYKGKDPDKDFKKEFVPTLKKVLAVYPQAKVKPVTGGVLLLGNFQPQNPSRIYMEYWMDWVIYYRDEAELRELASELQSAECTLLAEESGSQNFLKVRKP